MALRIAVNLYNPNGTYRWQVDIAEKNGRFELGEDPKHSLFSNPMATGATPGEALDNFLKVEQSLIDSL